MEGSQVIGDVAEECSSCESGWTMYLSSPTHHGDADDDTEMESAEVSCISSKRIIHAGDEEDDSMASDASTGGIQRNLSCDQFDVSDDDEEDSNDDAHSGFEEVNCCIQYPSHSLHKRRMYTVQETRSITSRKNGTVMVPTCEANDVIDSKVRHDIVAGDKL